jgi:hypothetical protein
MTDDERAILAFEESHPRNDRSKEAAVRETFGESWVRYEQRLQRLVKREDVLADYAVVASRVQRATEKRAALRGARRFG